jgi:hypothetical protein
MSVISSGIARLLIPIFSGTILASQVLLTACSDSTGPPPPPPPPPPVEPIPAYFYEVRITHAGNTCGAADPGAFEFLVLPEHTGNSYTMYGITENQEPVTVRGDTLTFSVPVQIEAGSVTIKARWIFAPERHGFSGTTEFQVTLTGRQPCSFSFATTGTHDISLHSPDDGMVHDEGHSMQKSALPGLPTRAATKAVGRAASVAGQPSVSLSRIQSQQASAASAAGERTWGDVGSVALYDNLCLTAGPGHVTEATLSINSPFPQSRTNGSERVYFRYTLYGVQDYDAAELGVLTEVTEPFQADYIALESGWWYADVNPSGSFFEQMFGARPWAGAEQATLQIPFERSSYKARNLSLGAGWWVTIDVYWPANGGLGWGWYHAVMASSTGGHVCRS